MEKFHICRNCQLILPIDLFFHTSDENKLCLGCREIDEAQIRWSNRLRMRGLKAEAEQIRDVSKSLKRKKSKSRPPIDADNFLNLRVWQRLIDDPEVKISSLCLGLSEEEVTKILPQIGFFNFYLHDEIKSLKEEKDEMELKFAELTQRLSILENEKLEIDINKMNLYS